MVSFIEYSLALGKDDQCKLEIVGLQVEEQIVCAANTSENTVSITFKSYADGTVKNSLGVAVYPVDGVLFSLGKENDVLITRWQTLLPDGIKNASGQYFVFSK